MTVTDRSPQLRVLHRPGSPGAGAAPDQPPPAGAALRLRGVSKSFGRVRALDRVDLDVEPGTLTAVLGASGCGKTTLLRVIAGFVTPDAGSVAVGDTVMSGAGTQTPPERRGVAVVPQEGALFPHLDVAANVGYGLGRRSPGRRRRVEEMLELVGLSGLGGRRPDELSGGQQQRVALARALAPSPAVVVLDEPFSALDAGLRAQLRTDVRQAMHAIGATGLIVTHDQVEALSVADTVAVMIDGQVRMHAAPHEVYHRPTDLGVARFVGDLVELPGTKLGDEIHCVLGALTVPSTLPDGPVLVCLRPEQLVADPADNLRVDVQRPTGLIEVQPAATGVVEDLLFHGHDSLARLRVPQPGAEPDLMVCTRVRVQPALGAEVRIRVDGTPLVFPG